MLRIAGYLFCAAACFFYTAHLFAQEAGLILHNANVITMNERQATAGSVAVRDGKITAVGTLKDLARQKGPNTKMVDMGGKTILPGFIDSHGHLIFIGLQRSVANLLPPPDGKGDSIASLRELLSEWASSEQAKRLGGNRIFIGFGYDDAQLRERRHPTRQELDLLSKDKPVVLIHQSGHLGSVNTAALKMANITDKTPNPNGGVIRREEDGKTPNGVLEETAWVSMLFNYALPMVSQGNLRFFIEQGQESCASFGYTTVQDGRSTTGILEALGEAASAGILKLDVVAYLDPFVTKSPFDSKWHGQKYHGHFRVGGIKINLDGSPQGKTAWLTQPYKVPPPGLGKDYRGYPTFRDNQLFPVVREAVEKKWQILAHCNGDAASDQYIAALNQAGDPDKVKATRPVMIHAQTVREDQLDAMVKIGIMPSFFNMHTYYWGDWHRDEVLGKERAYRISPSASAIQRGMKWTSHHDAPVALPNSIRILSSCVTRKSRTGDVIGPEQRVSVAEALKALTIHAAYQNGEESSKGSIEAGKLADFVILSDNPLTMNPDHLMDLKILQTIKEGITVYSSK